MSDFMQHQVTRLQNWVKVETTHGTEFIDAAGLSLFVRNSDCPSQPLTSDEREQTIAKIQPYVDGTPQSWENIKGYGARLSAPGYLDCTFFAVFDTQEEAEQYLTDEYPEDETEDEQTLYTAIGTIELSLTLEQAHSASHSGQCDEDVKALSLVPEVAKQLAQINAEELARELREYGAWDAEELADHDQNIQRLLWIAAGDIIERRQYETH